MPWDRPPLAAACKRENGKLVSFRPSHAPHTTDNFHSPHSFVLHKHLNRSQRRMLPADRATNEKPNRIEIKRRATMCGNMCAGECKGIKPHWCVHVYGSNSVTFGSITDNLLQAWPTRHQQTPKRLHPHARQWLPSSKLREIGVWRQNENCHLPVLSTCWPAVCDCRCYPGIRMCER